MIQDKPNVRISWRELLLLFLGILPFGCSSDKIEAQKNDLVALSIGSATAHVALAIDSAAQQRGLMFRDSLPQNQGMLFVYDAPQRMSFWMRNTRIPLDIGFFTADGMLREIYPLYPYDENARRSARSDLLYALEMNQGWFKKNGVKVGDALDVETLREAL